MEQKKLSQLTGGEAFEGFVLIKALALKTGQTGKNYIDLTVCDDSSSMNAKIWDYNDHYAQFTVNSLVKVRGNVVVWQNTMQLRIERIRFATEADPVSINDFVPSAPFTGESMLADVLMYADRIENNDIRAIVHYVLEKYRDRLLYWPAAMANHHSIRSGLLYHTLTMLKSGEALCGVYTHLNPDWVYGGVILHDIEKVNELNAGELGLVSDYTRDGLLLGHIVQCTLTIAEAGKTVNADPEIVVLLQHMITAHHYEPEFGSPKRPMFPEAELLHYLDIIDARMYDFTKALEETAEGGFTEKQWLLHNRRLYKRTVK